MGWLTAIRMLLFGFALSQCPMAANTKTALAGMPLSAKEYEDFFRVINNPRHIGVRCILRSTYGCQHPSVRDIDLLENHGLIPEGEVCSNLIDHPTFPNFCALALHRCVSKQYFVKRVLCPDETIKTSPDTQIMDQQTEPPSPSEISNDVPITAAAVTTTTTFLEWLASIFSTPATSVSKLPPVLSVPAASTTTPESVSEAPMDKVTVTTAQPFTPTTTTTTPNPSAELRPDKLVSEMIDSELRDILKTPEEVHPVNPTYITSTPIGSTTGAPSNTAGITSAPVTTKKPLRDLLESVLELLVPTAARDKLKSLLKRLTASVEQIAGQTSETATMTSAIPATTNSESTESQVPVSSTTMAAIITTSAAPSSEFPSSTSTSSSSSSSSTTTSSSISTTSSSISTTSSTTPSSTATSSSTMPTTTTSTASRITGSTVTHSSMSVIKKRTKKTFRFRTNAATDTTAKSSVLPTRRPITAARTTKTSAHRFPSVSSLSDKATSQKITDSASSTTKSSQDKTGLSPLLEIDMKQGKEIPQYPTSHLRDIFFQMQDDTMPQTGHMRYA